MIIEPGLLPSMSQHIEEVHSGRRGLLVMDEQVEHPHGEQLRAEFGEPWHLHTHLFKATEANKQLDSVASIYQSALSQGLDRGSLIMGVGGGVTGDVAGFAAATFLRGIDLVLIPTTLLSMVDASIGGKTGVNLPLPDHRGVGKNLAGAFWQPKAVLIDPLVLSTLDPREIRSGVAECIKHGFISDPSLLDFIRQEHAAILQADSETITRLVSRAVQVKVDVVQGDERESGRRAALNLGHTFGHVIEPIPELDLRHGEAVAIGMVAAAECACRLGRCDASVVGVTREMVSLMGLPADLPAAQPVEGLLEAMRFDKKTRDGHLRLVLPGEAGVDLIEDVPEEMVRAAWVAVGATT
ncbi:MAG: 3-dehydroquinate synthase [Phycisphaerales bacterium]|nr:3-dehydroquinate synthase [Phycisphaerales bacterium]